MSGTFKAVKNFENEKKKGQKVKIKIFKFLSTLFDNKNFISQES